MGGGWSPRALLPTDLIRHNLAPDLERTCHRTERFIYRGEGQDLELWQNDWEEYYREDEDAVYGEDEDDDEVLLECCGDKRPPTPPKLVVRASDKPYVNIDDYVSAVHPWLRGLRDNILLAMNAIEGPEPLPSDTQLMVAWGAPDSLAIMEGGRWIDYQRGGLRLQAGSGPRSINPPGTEEA